MVDPQRKGPQIVEFARARPAAAAGGYRIPMTAACHWSLIRSSGNISVLNFLWEKARGLEASPLR